MNFTVFFFSPGFPIKKDTLKQARDTICRVSYARVKEDLPNPVWIIHRQRRLMDMIIFLGGGGRKMEVLSLGIKVGNDLQMIDA